MKADPRFLGQNAVFWAHVRTLSQKLGYTKKAKRAGAKSPKRVGARRAKRPPAEVNVPTLDEMCEALADLNLETSHIRNSAGEPSEFGSKLLDYFQYRAGVINGPVQQHLMDARAAKKFYSELRRKGKIFRGKVPLNRQKKAKSAVRYLTAATNLLVYRNCGKYKFDPNPQQLTAVTKKRMPVRTLARRVDGAFPQVINPVAIWEVKEYYFTTTFGSRVADGIYESLLDGIELQELREKAETEIKHYLIIDGRGTWWDKGRSYLCRIIDMLHMGYVDELLVGNEIEQRLPKLVKEWVVILEREAGSEIEETGGRQSR
jgi:hypothetical protein